MEFADSAKLDDEAVVFIVEDWILGIVMTSLIVRYSLMLIPWWFVFGPGTSGFELFYDRLRQGSIRDDDLHDRKEWEEIESGAINTLLKNEADDQAERQTIAFSSGPNAKSMQLWSLRVAVLYGYWSYKPTSPPVFTL